MNSYLNRVVNAPQQMQSVDLYHIATDQARSTRSLTRAISVTQPNLAQESTLAKASMMISRNNNNNSSNNNNNNNNNNNKNKNKNKQKKPIPMFLQKMFHMLESAEHDQATYRIVSWSPTDHGYFTIYDEHAFSEQVIPKYFESSMSSFKRQLNYYGFVLIKDEVPVLLQDSVKKKKTISYRHEHGFLRKGRFDLLHNIRRSTCSNVVATDPKAEAAELKRKVQHLTKDVATLQNHVDVMAAKMEEFQKFMMSQRQFARQRECDAPSNLFVAANAPLNEPYANKSTYLKSSDNTMPFPRSHSTTGPASRHESTSSVPWEMLKDILEDEVVQDHSSLFENCNTFYSSIVTQNKQRAETSAAVQNNDYSSKHHFTCSEVEPELVITRCQDSPVFASSVSL